MFDDLCVIAMKFRVISGVIYALNVGVNVKVDSMAHEVPVKHFQVIYKMFNDLCVTAMKFCVISGVIYAFNVGVNVKVDTMSHKVPIKHFQVIYKMFDDLIETLNDLLPPLEVEDIVGKAIFSKSMTKPTKWPVCPVWSESSLSAWRRVGSFSSYPWNAQRRPWSDWCPGWSETLLGAQIILLVLSCFSSV